MRRNLFTLSVLLVFAGGAWADEKDVKPGTQAGPAPGKGWRKNETPTPAVPAPMGKGKLEATPTPTPETKAPAQMPPKEEGIGKYVSAWARSGIRGPQLAAKIHALQATMVKQTNPTLTPKKKDKKGSGEE